MKLGLSTAAALVFSLLANHACASDTDPWLGADKALHLGVSAGLAAGGYAVSSFWLDRRYERALAGGVLSLTLGASKELWDLSGHGDPSWRDFTWDAVGTAVGIALAVGVDALISPNGEARARANAQGLVFHF